MDLDSIRIADAAARLRGVVRRTPLARIDSGDPRVELRLKLENRQETGSFKARGAWNQVSQLTDAERHAGVVCTTSGNHGKALAWAARRANVRATILMPADAYPNKVQACRDLGAEVILCATRALAEEECARLVASGRVLVHPFDAARTIQGAGTIGLEIAEDWPEVEVVLVPVGGAGLISGVALAIRQSLGSRVKVIGAEPRGAPKLARGLEAGRPVVLERIESRVQGLLPIKTGQLNIDVCRAAVDRVILFEDEAAFAAQMRLVALGEVVEPAGAASSALVFSGLLPPDVLDGRSSSRPLRVAAVVSGGNPDPAQLEAIRSQDRFPTIPASAQELPRPRGESWETGPDSV